MSIFWFSLCLSLWTFTAVASYLSFTFFFCSWCYKTFVGVNLEYPKLKKLNKVCSNVWTCTKLWKQCYFYINLYSRTVYGFYNGLCLLFQFRGNLEFIDFLQKKFCNITYWSNPVMSSISLFTDFHVECHHHPRRWRLLKVKLSSNICRDVAFKDIIVAQQVTSVTRLGYFWKVVMTNFHAKVAQILGDF